MKNEFEITLKYIHEKLVEKEKKQKEYEQKNELILNQKNNQINELLNKV
jgi:hypothetical protein